MSDLFDEVFMSLQLKRLRADPMSSIEACQERYTAIDSKHNKATYHLIGFLCGFVEAVKKSSEAEKELREHDFWLGGHRPKEDGLTLAATRFAIGARKTKSELYERARTYGAVIDYYLDQGKAPKDVPHDLALVKIRGVLKWLKSEANADDTEGTAPGGGNEEAERGELGSTLRRPSAKSADDRDRVTSVPVRREDARDPSSNDGDDAPDAGDTELPSPAPHTGANGRSVRARSPSRFNASKDIVFAGGEYFDSIRKMREGQEVIVTLLCTKQDGDWGTLEATHMSRKLMK